MATNPGGIRPPSGGELQVRNITQTEGQVRGPDGKLTPGYTIGFTTPSNVRGSVDIPKSMYTVANVKAAILAHVNEIEGVQRLGS